MPNIGRALLLALTIAGTTQLRADGINNPASGGSSGAVGFIEGINNLGIGGSSGPPPTPCNAGQLDWSDATGCNLVFFR